MKFKANLQLKLLAIVALVIAITLSVFYFVSVNNQRRIFKDSFHDSAVSLAQALDAGIGSTAELRDVSKLQSNIYKMIWLSSNIISISMSLPVGEGLQVVASNNTAAIGRPPAPEALASYKDGVLQVEETVETDGTPVLRVITPVHVSGQRVGVYAIKISLDPLEASIAKTQREFLVLTLISIVVVIGLLSLFIKVTVIDSIKELLSGMEIIGRGKLTHRMTTTRRDEIGDLFSGLNGMAKNLAERTGELNRAKSHTEVVVENLADGLLEYSGTGELRRINRAAERLLGLTKSDVEGKVIPQNLPKESPLSTLSLILFPRDSFPSSVPSTTNAVIRNIDITQPLPTSLQIVTIALPTSPTQDGGYVSIVRDVTREKLIEQDKNSFISVAAHQMRTPLSATKWALNVILEDHPKEISDKVKELISVGATTTDRMITLVNDLLAVSRIEDGRYGYTFVENDLCALVKAISDEYAPLVEKKLLHFSLDCSPTLGHFRFDASKLSIAVHALVDNAVNYTKSGGSIAITVGEEKGMALIRVADTGIGIPDDSIHRLFTKFYRAENAIRMAPNGSGLGLFIVKNIITQHQGTIEAETNSLHGTTFTILLPLHGVKEKDQV